MSEGENSIDMERFRSLGRSAFVLGYTGEVGKVLVDELNKSKIFKRVVLIGRRQVPLSLGPEFEQKVIDFDKVEDHKDVFTSLDCGFCCLGTTRGKSGKEGFIKIDRDYVLNSAEVARSQGCKHFSLVSSQGANKNSYLLYPKIKGEVEEKLGAMEFDRLSIYRPGLLLCNRQERRVGEKIITVVLKPITYLFPTLMSAPVRTVAKAMINNVTKQVDGTNIRELYENKDIHHISQSATS
ncbi:oxidoreductase HTATIP2-like [Physella acuta]|uniref:oxidoreductase HTATIP2-like n=1 Tax=Physella acuta TaxID=109671 RepID=UPI0027DD9844|nr:oxidoreductase HTATIP2-like [Physella acuta]XP_059150820.1 oxidoreductase HTATIP2-like [Physella acuta]